MTDTFRFRNTLLFLHFANPGRRGVMGDRYYKFERRHPSRADRTEIHLRPDAQNTAPSLLAQDNRGEKWRGNSRVSSDFRASLRLAFLRPSVLIISCALSCKFFATNPGGSTRTQNICST